MNPLDQVLEFFPELKEGGSHNANPAKEAGSNLPLEDLISKALAETLAESDFQNSSTSTKPSVTFREVPKTSHSSVSVLLHRLAWNGQTLVTRRKNKIGQHPKTPGLLLT